MSDAPPPQQPQPQDTTPGTPLVDFTAAWARLRVATVVLAALALLGCVVDGVLHGLTFELMGRWAGLFVVALLATTAVVTALHALGGAGRAGQRGERLSAPDVGLSPRRLSAVSDEPADQPGRAASDPGDQG